LLRRYWHVAAAACELTEASPVKAVRLLGEDLILYRMPPQPGQSEATYGLIELHCPHRNASFIHGLVDCHGIRCIYHGWKFALDGSCLEQPAEGPDSSFRNRVRARSYPVQKLAGLLFAYLGPAPEPLLPRWDVLVREDGRRFGVIESIIDCNWLQAMENSVDPSHLYWLHGSLGSQQLPLGEERYAALGLQSQYGEQNEFFQDVLVNSAGILQSARILDADSADWRDMIDVNLLGLMLVTRAALPLLEAGEGGHVFNISSISARLANPGSPCYAATKAAVSTFNETLRKDVAGQNVRVTVVLPGLVETEALDTIKDPVTKERFAAMARKNKPLQPQDIANAIVFANMQPQHVCIGEMVIRPTAMPD